MAKDTRESTDVTGQPFRVQPDTGIVEHPLESVTFTFADGNVRTVRVVDTAIIADGGYAVSSQASPDGSYPTQHVVLVRWTEDADSPC